MRLLIVRLSAMGDIVHTLPLAANAARAGAQVGWLVETAYAPLLHDNPSITRLFVAATRQWRWNPLRGATRREFSALARELSEFQADAVIEAHGLWKSALLARLAGAPVIGLTWLQRRELVSALLIDRPVRVGPGDVHVVDQNLRLLEAAGLPVVERAPDARYLLARKSAEAETFLSKIARPFALYHPGAARPEKAWGESRYAELARRLQAVRGVRPVISWGPGDEARRDRMAAELPEADVLPRLDFSGLARVIDASALFVAGDTGPAHLADALGRPTLALFGPASRSRNVPRRNRPYRGEAMRYDETTAVAQVEAQAVAILDRSGSS
jgi:lipopolysaccharide heptosyltransferase I